MTRLRVIIWIVISTSVVLTFWLNPGLVRFHPLAAPEFFQLVAPLVLISAFMERATEVFVTAWRGGGLSKTSREVQRLKLKVTKGEQASHDDLEDAHDKLADYRSDTQRIAFLTTLGLGVVISALGIRALELFVDPAIFAALSSTQRAAFNVTDVLLTGASLGGGADGLHKMVNVFTTFMDATSNRARRGRRSTDSE
jgi:hypothetical protein